MAIRTHGILASIALVASVASAQEVEQTITEYPNGTEVYQINNHPTANGMYVFEKGSRNGIACDGDNATPQSQEECKSILGEAADSGEPVEQPQSATVITGDAKIDSGPAGNTPQERTNSFIKITRNGITLEKSKKR